MWACKLPVVEVAVQIVFSYGVLRCMEQSGLEWNI